jgi:diguanylate cyclase (GGDEF)-like protein/PAS domain S-box-containing protein
MFDRCDRGGRHLLWGGGAGTTARPFAVVARHTSGPRNTAHALAWGLPRLVGRVAKPEPSVLLRVSAATVMSSTEPPPNAPPAAARASVVRKGIGGCLNRILHDYPPSARRVWCLLAAIGVGVGLWSLDRLAHSPHAVWSALAIAAAGLLSMMPVRLPRTTFVISTADLCVFLAMAKLDPATAIAAAGADGAVGSWQSSKRASSRILGPLHEMGATAAAVAAYSIVDGSALATALDAAGAQMLALGAAALVKFVASTYPLTAMAALKRRQVMSVRQWLSTCAWVGTSMQVAALVAGIIGLSAHFGIGLLVASAAIAAAAGLLLKVALSLRAAEQDEHERTLEAARREAEVNQQRFTAAFSNAAIAMAIVARDGKILKVNRALCELTGSQASEVVGIPISDLFSVDDRVALDTLTRQTDNSVTVSGAYPLEMRCRRPNGGEGWVTVHCGHFDNPQADERGLIYQLLDISMRRAAEQRLQHIAYHDALTDLANRALFTDRLARSVESSRINPTQRFAVLFLDMDRFKAVNDSLGHTAGNVLLCAVAKRLTAEVGPRDLVARLGGDEFAILFHCAKSFDEVHGLAGRLLARLAEPFIIGNSTVSTGVSIGITFSDLGYRTVEEVLRDADVAMYEAKARGRGDAVVFDSSMHERITQRLALEIDLRRAINEHQLSLAFQPIYDLRDLRPVGFEALARWHHPQRGDIDPSLFIGLAEDAGYVGEITQQMIDRALGHLAVCRDSAPQFSQLTVNVNMSGFDLARPGMAASVARLLRSHGLPAAALTLEITETRLMSRMDESLSTLRELRELGVRVSIDDFGTGYSSLAYLGTLPIDSLKIDRSFVQGLDRGSPNTDIVRTVVHLGLNLGKSIVAEGIENRDQLQRLRALGVERGQGYLLSKPLPPERIREWLLAHALELT